jgi:hypothetical protein
MKIDKSAWNYEVEGKLLPDVGGKRKKSSVASDKFA